MLQPQTCYHHSSALQYMDERRNAKIDIRYSLSHRGPERRLHARNDQPGRLQPGGRSFQTDFARLFSRLHDDHTKPIEGPAFVGLIRLVAARVSIAHPDDFAIARNLKYDLVVGDWDQAPLLILHLHLD